MNNNFTVTYDLDKALNFDPFEGYYGCDVKTHRDKIVTAGKDHECHHCNKGISKKEKYRKFIEVSGGEMLTFCFCALCCVAVLLDHENDGSAFDDRLGKH